MGAWLVSGKQFHVMRDGPFHTATILAGLWGALNYLNMSRATQLREAVKIEKIKKSAKFFTPQECEISHGNTNFSLHFWTK